MAAEETTTWGEVCKQVGFRDSLYRTCRDKVTGWQPGSFAGGAFDEVPDEGPDFTRQLARTAKPIPKPPKDEPEEGEDEAEGFFDAFPVKKLLVYGGVAAVAYFLLMRKSEPAKGLLPKQIATTSDTPASATPQAA